MLENIKERLTERRLKQRIKELRFKKNDEINPLHLNFKKSISAFAWNHIEEQLAIIEKKKTSYDYILENDEYSIKSRNETYLMKSDCSRCSCEFFCKQLLPCRHILFFLSNENKEIPTGVYSDHWLGGCTEVMTSITFIKNKMHIILINVGWSGSWNQHLTTYCCRQSEED